MPTCATTSTSGLPLDGVRVVEVSSFVASPLCGLTLSQLGAEVIRVDPTGGAADYRRWPLAPSGDSIYWAGLNKGKRSVEVDLRSREGQQQVQQLVIGGGPSGGILVTNTAGRDWLGHQTLAKLRDDVITLHLLGRHDGSTAVDYTVNARVGFPQITGPGHGGVVNHVLPAWDLLAGLYAALAVTAAVRRREVTGQGAEIVLPLEDVALATAGNLGYLAEVQLNGRGREGTANAVYGTYGSDFETSDGARFMIVALTTRHFEDLMRVTGTTDAVTAVAGALGADFTQEGERYRHRVVLTALLSPWFSEHSAEEVAQTLRTTSVLAERYQTFEELVASGELTTNPLFARIHQQGVGPHEAPGLPATFDGVRLRSTPAPRLGEDTAILLHDTQSP